MRSFCILVLCCFVSGCAYRVTLRSDSPSEDFAKANRAFRSLHCQVQLADTTLAGQSDVRFDRNTIRWNNPATGEARQAPFPNVYRIKATNHKKGIIPGALAGLLVGTAAGAAAGAAHVRNTQGGGWMDFGDITGGIVLGFCIGVPVFIAGIMIGHSIGAPVDVQIDSFTDSTSSLSR